MVRYGGAFAKCGKVRGQTKKVGKISTGKKKKTTGRAYQRELYNKRQTLLNGNTLYEFNEQEY